MNRLPGALSLKRKQPDSNKPFDSLTDHERIVYELILSKQDMGIWIRDMKRESKLPDTMVNKSVKTLVTKRLIKEVVNIQNKGRKHYMAIEFEPSEEISGGTWYVDGHLDRDFINILKGQCLRHIRMLKIATTEMVADAIKRSKLLKEDYSAQKIGQIVTLLVLDDLVMELESTGTGEFASIPSGRICYKSTKKSGPEAEPEVGVMASIPCGVCPRLNYCTPDGMISPATCVYYDKWLDF